MIPDTDPAPAWRRHHLDKPDLKILIVRVSSLGDVVHNLPMVQDMLRQRPDAQIDWVVEEAYATLVRLQPGVRRIIPIALRRWRRRLWRPDTWREIRAFLQALRVESYDFIFDTQGLLKTALVMRAARLGAEGQRIGLANATEGSGYESVSRYFHHVSVAVDVRTHAVERARLLPAAVLNYAVDTPARFELQLPPALSQLQPDWLPPSQRYAVLFHATARAAKQWPAERWIQIGEFLHRRGLPVLLAWGNPVEQAQARQLAQAMPNASVLPKLSMADAVLLAQRATLAIGVDTGLTHLAAALGTPSIELYCDSPRWKTEGNWSPRIINLGDQGAPPSVAQVQAAIDALLTPPQPSA